MSYTDGMSVPPVSMSAVRDDDFEREDPLYASGKRENGTSWTILNGDSKEVASTLAPASINCVITSPPYYWQRDYEVDGQFGLEPTIDGYVENLRETFAATPIELAKRYGLDAVVIGDVRRAQWFPPQRLDLSVDLIAVETGLPIWSGSVDLDSGDERVRTALKRWYRHERRGEDARGETWELYLLSPRLFFEFAAAQTARGF